MSLVRVLPSPLQCCATTAGSNNTRSVLIGGGGGASKTGVKNFLWNCDLDESELAEQQVIVEAPDTVSALAVHPTEAGVIVYSSASKVVGLKKAKDGYTETGTANAEARVTQLTFSAGGDVLAAGTNACWVWIWSFPSLKKIATFKSEDTKNKTIKALAVHPNKKLLAISLGDSKVLIWSIESQSVVHTLTNKVEFRGCYFTRDGTRLITSAISPMKGSGLLIFEFAKGAENPTSLDIIKFRNRITPETATSFAVSPDEDLVALGTADGAVVVVATKNLYTQSKWKSHAWVVTSVAFVKPIDNKPLSVASASIDSRVVVHPLVPDRSWVPRAVRALVFLLLLIVLLVLLRYGYAWFGQSHTDLHRQGMEL